MLRVRAGRRAATAATGARPVGGPCTAGCVSVVPSASASTAQQHGKLSTWDETAYSKLLPNIQFLRLETRLNSPLSTARSLDFSLESARDLSQQPIPFEIQMAHPPSQLPDYDLPPVRGLSADQLALEEKLRWATSFELAADSHPSIDFDVLELTDEEFFLTLYKSDAALKVLAPDLQHSLEFPGEVAFVPLPLRLGVQAAGVQPHLNQSRPLDADIDSSLHRLRERRLHGQVTSSYYKQNQEGPSRMNRLGQITHLCDTSVQEEPELDEFGQIVRDVESPSPKRFEAMMEAGMKAAARSSRGEAECGITSADVVNYINQLRTQTDYPQIYEWYMNQPFLHSDRAVTNATVLALLNGHRLDNMWEIVQLASQNSCVSATQLECLVISAVTVGDVLRTNLALKKYMRNFSVNALSDRALHSLFRHFTDVGAYFAACMVAEFCRATKRELKTVWSFAQIDKYPSLYACLGMTQSLAEILLQHASMRSRLQHVPRRSLSALQQFVHMVTTKEIDLLMRVALAWIRACPQDARLLLVFARVTFQFKDLQATRKLWHTFWDLNPQLDNNVYRSSPGVRNNTFNCLRNLAELILNPTLDPEVDGSLEERQRTFFTVDALRIAHIDLGFWPQPAVNSVLSAAVGYDGPIPQISLHEMLKLKLAKLIRYGFNTSNTPGDHVVRGTLLDIIRMHQVGETELGRRRLVQFIRFLSNPQPIVDAAVAQLDQISLLMLTKMVLGLRSFAYSTMVLFLPSIYLRLAQTGEWATLVLTFSEVFNHHFTRTGDLATDRLRDLQPAFRILPSWTLSRIVEESLSVYRSPQQIEYFIRTLSRCDMNHLRMDPEGKLPDFHGTRAHIRAIFPLVRELKTQKHILAMATLEELMMCLGRNLSTETATVIAETLRLFFGDSQAPLVPPPGQPSPTQLMGWFSMGLQQLAELKRPCQVLQDIRQNSHVLPFRVVSQCFKELASSSTLLHPSHYAGAMIGGMHSNFNIGGFLQKITDWFRAQSDVQQAVEVVIQVLMAVLAQAINHQAHLVNLLDVIMSQPYRLPLLSSPVAIQLIRRSPYGHLASAMIFRRLPFQRQEYSDPALNETMYRVWAQIAAQSVAEHPELFMHPLMFQFPPPEPHPEDPADPAQHPPMSVFSRGLLQSFLRHGNLQLPRVLHEVAPLLSPFDIARLFPLLVSLCQSQMVSLDGPMLALEALARTHALHFATACSRWYATENDVPTSMLIRLKNQMQHFSRIRRTLQFLMLELVIRQGDCTAAVQTLLSDPFSQIRRLYYKKDIQEKNVHFLTPVRILHFFQQTSGSRVPESRLLQALDVKVTLQQAMGCTPAELAANPQRKQPPPHLANAELMELLAQHELRARRAAELGLRPHTRDHHNQWMTLAAESGHLPSMFAARRFIIEHGFVPLRRAGNIAHALNGALSEHSEDSMDILSHSHV